jgi:hypothetical protein
MCGMPRRGASVTAKCGLRAQHIFDRNITAEVVAHQVTGPGKLIVFAPGSVVPEEGARVFA